MMKSTIETNLCISIINDCSCIKLARCALSDTMHSPGGEVGRLLVPRPEGVGRSPDCWSLAGKAWGGRLVRNSVRSLKQRFSFFKNSKKSGK